MVATVLAGTVKASCSLKKKRARKGEKKGGSPSIEWVGLHALPVARLIQSDSCRWFPWNLVADLSRTNLTINLIGAHFSLSALCVCACIYRPIASWQHQLLSRLSSCWCLMARWLPFQILLRWSNFHGQQVNVSWSLCSMHKRKILGGLSIRINFVLFYVKYIWSDWTLYPPLLCSYCNAHSLWMLVYVCTVHMIHSRDSCFTNRRPFSTELFVRERPCSGTNWFRLFRVQLERKKEKMSLWTATRWLIFEIFYLFFCEKVWLCGPLHFLVLASIFFYSPGWLIGVWSCNPVFVSYTDATTQVIQPGRPADAEL